jgi:two-component system, cell cycle response regulator DivK
MTRKVLVADDNNASRELIREVLEMSGYDVVEAADGQDAVTAARENAIDLALVDVQMPRLDGYGVLRELRADPRLRGVPVAALTAFAMQGDRERALEAGFDAYITKPVDIAALRQEIRKLLSL